MLTGSVLAAPPGGFTPGLVALVGLPRAGDEVPEDDDVVAGWLGAVVFVALILAVVLLGRSLLTHLRRAQANKDAGAFGDNDDER